MFEAMNRDEESFGLEWLSELCCGEPRSELCGEIFLEARDLRAGT
jgi:hypothetical protein